MEPAKRTSEKRLIDTTSIADYRPDAAAVAAALGIKEDDVARSYSGEPGRVQPGTHHT